MNKSVFRYATFLALVAAFISGTNNFLAKIAVTAVRDPIVYTTLKNSLVAIFFVGLILMLKKWPEIRSASKKQLGQLAAIGVVGGSIPFALYFTGLAQTSATNASMIHVTLLVWVFLFAIPILKESMNPLQWVGVGVIFAANLFVGSFVGFKYNLGELMILIATILWGVENVIAKQALQSLSSTTVAGARMVLGSLVLLLITIPRGGTSAIFALGPTQWGWTVLTAILLCGYVLSWYTALKHAPATYVATLIVPAALVTNVLSAVFITHTLSGVDTLNSLLYITGIVLVILFANSIGKKAASNKAPVPQST